MPSSLASDSNKVFTDVLKAAHRFVEHKEETQQVGGALNKTIDFESYAARVLESNRKAMVYIAA